MCPLVIRHSMGHNFIVEAESQTVLLSYKGAGGRSKVTALGNKGINTLVSMAHTAMLCNQNSTAIRSLFCSLGCKNALLLLESFYPNEWIQYWTRIVSQRKSNGQGCSFRAVLQEVSGSRSTLAHYPPSDMLQVLHNICGEALNAPRPADHALPSPDRAESDGVVVNHMFQQNNMLLFDVNGHTISFCTNRVHKILSAENLLHAVHDLKSIVQNQGDLASLTVRWGGTFVFRLLGALYPQDTIRYFQALARQKAIDRELIEPRNLLTSFHYSCNDPSNQAFTNALLSALEQCRKDSIPLLIDGNDTEVSTRNDHWILYYDYDRISYRTFDFSHIKDAALRLSAVEFLRDIWLSCSSISVAQLARYFYLLRDGLNALSDCSYIPLHQIDFTHARLIKSYLERIAQKSANSISETLQLLGRMYAWATLTHDQNSTPDDNPFYSVVIPNKRAFLHTTPPADFSALSIIHQHLVELPEYVRLAHNLIVITSARSNDILRSTVKDYSFLADGTAELHLVTSKNSRAIRFKIPAEVATQLKQYMDCTAAFRAESGSDYLFLYHPTGIRAGSRRLPQLLTSNTYNYHINQILTRYAPDLHITARQIRAESGRRYHCAGYTSSQTAIALANSPQVAKKHYRTLSAEDEAHLYHQMYQRCFSNVLSPAAPSATPEPLWGRCSSSSTCRSVHTCQNCPYLTCTEVIESA